jgi:hypothetical protein
LLLTFSALQKSDDMQRRGLPYNKAVEFPRAHRIGRHEAGHYVAARVLGFNAGAITLELRPAKQHQGGAAITLAVPVKSVDDVVSYLERRIQVLYAGALAETMEVDQVDEKKACEVLEAEASQDAAKVREYVLLLRNIRFPDTPAGMAKPELDEISQKLWLKTIELVKSERLIIQGIGKRLASMVDAYAVTVTLTAEELEQMPALQERFGAPEPQPPSQNKCPS